MTPSHLGGHLFKTHTDEAVFNYIVGKYGVKTVLDIGCGPGWMYDLARSKGVAWIGIDGDPAVKGSRPYILLHDFTTGPLFGPHSQAHFDLAWSTEFVEHVEERYIPNFMDSFDRADRVVMTHALPGDTGGHHHVNLQTSDYWVSIFQNYNFYLNELETSYIRSISSMTKDFMRSTGMVFDRTKPE